MKEHTKKWLRAACIRAVRTVAQSALAIIGTAVVLGDVNWVLVASSAALSGVNSILTSVVTSLPEV